MSSNKVRKKAISSVQIDCIFDLVKKGTANSVIASIFGRNVKTITAWYQQGEEYFIANEELAQEISDLYLGNTIKIEEIVNDNYEEYKENYLKKIGQEELTSKNSFGLQEYIRQEKIKLFETICKSVENDAIDRYVFNTEDEQLNQDIIDSIKYYRAYTRGRICDVTFLQDNINKHCGSSKNVNLSLKRLEMTVPEYSNSKPEIKEVRHSGEIVLIESALKGEKLLKLQEEENNK